jgi:hypothetical protein
MKSYLKGMLMLALLTLTAFSCDQKQVNPSAPVTFKFALLNSVGENVTTFRAGEAVIFSFKIINNSNEDLFLKQSSLDTEEFFKVYRIETAEGNRKISMGKPYKSIFCTYQLGVLVPANGTLHLELPWMPDDDYHTKHFCSFEKNTPLPKGTYKTGFSSSFEFMKGPNSYKTDALNFNIDFEIK